MSKVIGKKNAGICKYLRSTVNRKMGFKCCLDVSSNKCNKCILTIFKNSYLILRLFAFVCGVVFVGNKTLSRNDSSDAFSGFFAPFAARKVNSLIGIYIVMTINEFYLGARTRSVLTDFCRNTS